MGYSARYHAFSIIAIFFALAIGLVIGAGFGDDVVSGASQDLEDSLAGDLEEADRRERDLVGELEQERAFGLRAYPALVDGLLEGESVGVIALGDISDRETDEIQDAVEPAGGEVSKVAVVREPADVDELEEELGGPLSNFGADEESLAKVSRRLGSQLVTGGGMLDQVRERFLDRFSGAPGKVDRVIVVARPGSGSGPSRGEFIDGVVEGVKEAGKPVVAVELAEATPSNVPFFDAHDVSTVDSLDLPSGKLSAVYALLGSEGKFGIKETADRETPDLMLPPPEVAEREADKGKSGKSGRRSN